MEVHRKERFPAVQGEVILKPAAHESYLLGKKLLVPVSSADSSPCAGTFY